MKIALHIAYFGKNYFGLQIQPNNITIGSELLKTLEKSKLIKKNEQKNLKFAGRTDKGVSAIQQVVTIITDHNIIISQINHHLPSDICLLGKKIVNDDFDPRKHAIYREYRYILVGSDLDILRIKEASELFLGTKSFHNFTKEKNKDLNRTILDIKVHKDHNFIFIDIKSKSFLWEQVRKICYVLQEVGKGNLSIKEIKTYFDPNVTQLIPSLSPDNLILMKIKYKDLEFEYDKKELYKFRRYFYNLYMNTQVLSEVFRQFRDFKWNM